MRVPWTARISKEPTLKEINPKNSLEELILEAEVPILWAPIEKS